MKKRIDFCIGRNWIACALVESGAHTLSKRVHSLFLTTQTQTHIDWVVHWPWSCITDGFTPRPRRTNLYLCLPFSICYIFRIKIHFHASNSRELKMKFSMKFENRRTKQVERLHARKKEKLKCINENSLPFGSTVCQRRRNIVYYEARGSGITLKMILKKRTTERTNSKQSFSIITFCTVIYRCARATKKMQLSCCWKQNGEKND